MIILKLAKNNISLRKVIFYKKFDLGFNIKKLFEYFLLGFTYRILIVISKLEPFKEVKIINIPSGVVVKDILVSDGE